MEPNEANAETKKQFIDAVKQGTHILVTVRNNPSVDQLASCIALTVLLNELGKRATAVFSGKVPSTIEFLKPGKLLQRTTDSLQDFIISLDKLKADKLRYKVEDTMVKIYITPYQTSITDKDLVYGKGDFNVDVVIALGAHSQVELDRAITAHGRILHDATVISMNNIEGPTTDLGSINWVDSEASSLSEMIAQVVEELADGKQDVLDSQVSTALLAGIVAETESFGNSKTSPTTMEVAGRLLAAGANQELVATKLTGPLKHELPAARAAAESHPHGRKHKETAAEKDEASTAHASHKQTADYDTPATPEVDTTDGELITGTATAAATHADPELPDGSVDIIDQPTAASDISNGASSEESEMVTTPVIDNSIDASDLADVASSVAEEISATDASETVVTEPAPQVYDLSESNAPASVPDAPDVVPTGSDQSLLQPLRDQNGLVSQPPLYDKAATAAQEGTTESVDSTLDPTKFALTPPSLGGRLSGTDDAEEPTPPANPLAEAEAAVVTHHSMMTHGAPGVPGSAAVDASTTATATAPDAAPVAAAVMHHEKKLVVPGSEPAPATPVLADASNPLAGLEVIDPNASPASAPAFASVAPVAPVAPAPTMMPASFGTSDENELAALGIIQPGSTNMAAPLPGLAPGSQPIGSAPPLTAPPQPVGSFGMPR